MDQDDELARAIALSLEADQGSEPTSSNDSHEQSSHEATGRGVAAMGVPLELPPSELSSIHAEDRWLPNEEHLQVVMSMGISENAATRALYFTGNKSAQEALEWVCGNLENPELHQPFFPPRARPSPRGTGARIVVQSLDDAFSETSYKMVFAVNTELKMGSGKMAAQVGHAAVALYAFLRERPDVRDQVAAWEDCGSKKIVLKGRSASHLAELAESAEAQRVPAIAIRDAGRTQVEPGSLTVLALFGRSPDVDRVTGHLKLM